MSDREVYWLLNVLFLLIVLSDYRKDGTEVGWRRFLLVGLPLLLFIGMLLQYAAPFWYWVVSHSLAHGHQWHWDKAFSRIPLNDGAVFRFYRPKFFTWFMRWVYNYGFILAWGAALLRSFLARDVFKMVRYTLASHMLQLPIIVPFYATILLNEVWYVNGLPDGMDRGLTGDELLMTVQNCFPSMHTSVSFAVLLLVLREKGGLFRWTMAVYCSLIIFSTLYLAIHWVLDVAAGIALGGLTVLLVDKLLGRWRLSQSGQVRDHAKVRYLG